MKKIFAVLAVLPLVGVGACMSHEVERYPADRAVVIDDDFDDFEDREVEIDVEHEYDD
jgi:hypothetical protein